MGRPPIGERAMTGAERQRRRRDVVTAKLVMLDDENTLFDMQRRYESMPELYALLRKTRQQIEVSRRALDSAPSRPFTCRWCGKSFATRHTVRGVRGGEQKGLNAHIEEAHSGEFDRIFEAIDRERLPEPDAHMTEMQEALIYDDEPDDGEVDPDADTKLRIRQERSRPLED
jgi:hypothetical protein